MNIWQFLWAVLQSFGARWDVAANFMWSNKLELLGYVQSAVAVIAVSTGIIPLSHLPYWMLANAVLTIWSKRANPTNTTRDITVPKPKDAAPDEHDPTPPVAKS